MTSYKRTSAGTFKSSEQQITEWLEEIDEEGEDFSGDDDVNDPDFVAEEIIFEDDEISLEARFQEEGNSFAEVQTESISEHLYRCKNGFVWSDQEVFATDGTGREIFRCVMSKYRFSCLVNCLLISTVVKILME
uniref:Uncharacterized protein n=1 Tax=Musca domestica TaxID=7370 RepID=A0A1I8N812_MUSDO